MFDFSVDDIWTLGLPRFVSWFSCFFRQINCFLFLLLHDLRACLLYSSSFTFSSHRYACNLIVIGVGAVPMMLMDSVRLKFYPLLSCDALWCSFSNFLKMKDEIRTQASVNPCLLKAEYILFNLLSTNCKLVFGVRKWFTILE